MSNTELITEEYLDQLNDLLNGPYSTPMGAYCLGLVSAICWAHPGASATSEVMPTPELMAAAADCTSVDEAVRLAWTWCKERS